MRNLDEALIRGDFLKFDKNQYKLCTKLEKVLFV